MKKWIAKGILLQSYDYYYNALVYVINPFINKIRLKYPDTKWYCSRKTEIGFSKPRIRIYLYIYEEKELDILSDLDECLNEKKDEIGWTGLYYKQDPITPDPQKPNLCHIQTACEIALFIMERHPCINEEKLTEAFIQELSGELKLFYNSLQKNSVAQNEISETLHFVANNLGMNDEFIAKLLS